MEYNDDQRLHLEFVENTITRLGGNSFNLKGWCITIVAAFLAIYADKGNPIFLYVAIAPTVLFWILDAKYLRAERQYRRLYSDLTTGNNLKISKYSMDASKYIDGNCKFLKIMFWSWSITLLYVVIIVILISLGLLTDWIFPTVPTV
ncbi:MAG: hypothetical protein RBR97_19310 [Bacteroidales bacterium]|jgi:hypothetical protein|nr:hypothetical protein [Bacteroidales bacterium]